MRIAALILQAWILMPMQSSVVNVTGKWTCHAEWPGHDPGAPTFILEQKGEDISGTYSGGLGEFKVQGNIKSNNVRFDLEGGRMHVEAKLDKDGRSMAGTAKTPSGDGTITCSKK
jgi:hypothetical protein